MGTIQDMIRKLESFGDEIKSLSGKTIKFLAASNGMIDRQCPSCDNLFMIHEDAWDRTGSHLYCPSCGHYAQKADFTTDEHRTQIKQSIERSLLKNWHSNTPIQQNVVEVQSTFDQENPVTCSSCASTYSSAKPIGYCAGCGKPSEAPLSGGLFF